MAIISPDSFVAEVWMISSRSNFPMCWLHVPVLAVLSVSETMQLLISAMDL